MASANPSHQRTAESKCRHFPLELARQAPLTEGDLSSLLLAHGSMTLEFYSPRAHDPQRPHAKDEVYVITRGRGFFRCDSQRTSFAAGDAIFVPAGAQHRFEDFSDDFETWVIFYGAEGGE